MHLPSFFTKKQIETYVCHYSGIIFSELFECHVSLLKENQKTIARHSLSTLLPSGKLNKSIDCCNITL